MRKTGKTLAAFALVVALGIGGTLAYLTDSVTVVNTFTVGNVDIELTETTGAEYKMIPGQEIAKDPVVTVDSESESCWLFVEVTPLNNEGASSGEAFIEWEIDSAWTPLDGSGVVFYAAYDGTTSSYNVLAGNSVEINHKIVKADMDALEIEGATLPTLTITAYAVQMAGFEDNPAGAWAAVTA